jgi:hypothetical protein
MKYMWSIIFSTMIFTVIGLISAFGMAEYTHRGQPRPDYFFVVFTMLPLGGAVVGLVIGCIAAALGHRFRDRRQSEFETEHDDADARFRLKKP